RLAVDGAQPLEKLRCPPRAIVQRMLERPNDQPVAADTECFRPSVDRLQQRRGNMHRRRHEYIREYIMQGSKMPSTGAKRERDELRGVSLPADGRSEEHTSELQ